MARVTCGLVAPRDKSLTIVGDDGIIYTSTVRNDIGPVYVQHIPPRGRSSGIERRMNRVRQWLQMRIGLCPWSRRGVAFQTEVSVRPQADGIAVAGRRQTSGFQSRPRRIGRSNSSEAALPAFGQAGFAHCRARGSPSIPGTFWRQTHNPLHVRSDPAASLERIARDENFRYHTVPQCGSLDRDGIAKCCAAELIRRMK